MAGNHVREPRQLFTETQRIAGNNDDELGATLFDHSLDGFDTKELHFTST
jgi:hypothetical protein